MNDIRRDSVGKVLGDWYLSELMRLLVPSLFCWSYWWAIKEVAVVFCLEWACQDFSQAKTHICNVNTKISVFIWKRGVRGEKIAPFLGIKTDLNENG